MQSISSSLIKQYVTWK